ncbi:hypothetical protein BDZ94DRAFT_1258084 [Collybia nuda]|uniref:Uncharacterized protein n=1 Tax=Collybia nuda TaxID=64659 RepID=A0A9P5Y5S3_9AGAR|nr:hypothetical protein BDZ94DRAFT_1258084 [Collybia nuda]
METTATYRSSISGSLKLALFRRREGPQPEPEGDDLWVDACDPCEMLNDEDEEEEWEDTVFDFD